MAANAGQSNGRNPPSISIQNLRMWIHWKLATSCRPVAGIWQCLADRRMKNLRNFRFDLGSLFKIWWAHHPSTVAWPLSCCKHFILFVLNGSVLVANMSQHARNLSVGGILIVVLKVPMESSTSSRLVDAWP